MQICCPAYLGSFSKARSCRNRYVCSVRAEILSSKSWSFWGCREVQQIAVEQNNVLGYGHSANKVKTECKKECFHLLLYNNYVSRRHQVSFWAFELRSATRPLPSVGKPTVAVPWLVDSNILKWLEFLTSGFLNRSCWESLLWISGPPFLVNFRKTILKFGKGMRTFSEVMSRGNVKLSSEVILS